LTDDSGERQGRRGIIREAFSMDRLWSSRAIPFRRLMPAWLVLTMSALLLTACYSPSQSGYLPPADTAITAPKAPPPAHQEEVPAAPPGPANYFVWDDGHWHWDGKDYVWIPGRYIERPYIGANWVPGRWDDSGNTQWTYTPGHWR
jgi:hypothetical protein